MSEPIKLYTRTGDTVAVYAPSQAIEMVNSGDYFIVAPEPFDDIAIEHMIAALDEEE